jgi:xylulokinase
VAAADPVFVAVDVGTTGARAAVIDLVGTRVNEVRRPYPTTTPHPSWAEQDPRLWAERAVAALAGLPRRTKQRIGAIGLTGQCPSVCPVGRHGEPVGPGLIYRDNRAVLEAIEMRRKIGVEEMHRRTGHTAEAFHVGPKVLWLRRHRPDVFAAAHFFLQPRDLVLHRLTGAIRTDESHANATLFFDLMARCWAPDLFEAFTLDPGIFPEAVPSATVVADLPRRIADETGLPAGIPVVIGAGDSQCVAFGTGVIEPGPISEMSGASSCINSTVSRPAKDLRITHYSHVVPDRFTTEVGLNTTGAAVTWALSRLAFSSFDELAAAAKRAMRRMDRVAEEERMDRAPLFLPYLGDGERDDPSLRGAFLGVSERHDRADLAYAVVEGVAAGVARAVGVLADAGSPLEELRVSGGGARLDVLGQLKADLLSRPVLHLGADASATGAALLAAASVGYDARVQTALAQIRRHARRFEPVDHRHRVLTARQEWFERARRSDALHRPEPEGH